MPFTAPHLILPENSESLPYTSINSGRSITIRTDVDRTTQGEKVRNDFNVAVENAGYADTEFIYVTFRSAYGFFLDLDKLDKRNFRLSSIKRVEDNEEDENNWCYEATICLNRDAVAGFLEKIENYINNNTKRGNPKNASLIANIEAIRAATIQSFWQEPEIPFPDPNENIWWEVWLHRNNDDDIDNPFPDLINNLIEGNVQVSQRHLLFPEHWVYLLKANVSQLGLGLLYTNRLAELRKPKETAEFFINLNIREQEQLIDDLNERVYINENRNISVCLLDTGVTISNPLLSNLVDQNSLDAVEPAWTRADSINHGTPMAGLILYGDLSEVLANDDRVQIFHTLESIKLIENNHAHDPELYGAVTEEAVARGEILNPDNKRVVCMAITADDLIHYGRPSSWSSAIDQLLFGTIDEPNDKTLFFISSGNLPHEERAGYPLVNANHSIKDPAQSFNAITVGAYTLKDQIDAGRFPNTERLADRGAPSPCNTTSIEWDNEWCRKPDIVMEGGNHGIHDGSIRFIDSLELLSTSTGGIGRPPLRTFADTSAATALAAKFAAELYYAYPNLRPETIRGLIIHSANWTPAMLENRKINELNENERRTLIQTVGYGVPNLNKAKESANNSLSLIAERILKPYKFEDSRIKSNEFHLFDLPWPVEVLQGLFNTEVELKVTLSYFIEPNPGNKRYELAASYRSHGLRFKVIDRGESLIAFKARISKNMREDDYLAEGSEHWLINSNIRDKGSIHKDIWRGTAFDLSRRNKIAVYPVGGWWRTRKQLNRFNDSVSYSLIVTIEAPKVDVDLYSPVLNLVEIES